MKGFMGTLRQNMKTVLWILAILFGGSLFFIGTGSQGQRRRILTLGRVDGEAILRNVYQLRLRDEYARRSRLGENPEVMTEMEDQKIRRSVKVQLFRDTALQAQAKSFGLTPRLDEVASAVRAEGIFRDATGSFSPYIYQNVLAREGLSPQQFESMTEGSLMIARMRQIIRDLTPVTPDELASEWRRQNRKVRIGYVYLEHSQFLEKVGIPEEDLKEYFDLNRTDYDTPAEAQTRHILSALQSDPSAQEIESARSSLKTLRERIIAKELDFSEAAKQFSMDTQTAPNGGSLGWLRQNEIMQDFAGIFDLALSTPSEPIQTRYGFHLFLVEEKKSGKEAVFEKARPGILARLAGPEARGLVRESLARLLLKSRPYETQTHPAASLSEAAASINVPYKEAAFVLSEGPEDFEPAGRFLDACRDLEPGDISPSVPAGHGFLVVHLLEQEYPEAPSESDLADNALLASALRDSKSLAVMHSLADGLLLSAEQAGRLKDYSAPDNL